MRRAHLRLPLLVASLLLLGACAAPSDGGTPSTAASAPDDTPAVTPSDRGASAAPSAAASDEGPASSEGGSSDPLLTAELVDVRTGDRFTLAELAADEPVIVETMAIWCSNCRAQMHEVTAAHELAPFHSVSIDVEPTEIAEDLSAYAAREGFDWPFVLADAELATLLRDRFGSEILFPPGMPKLLVRPDGSVELLPLGELLSAAAIADLVES